MSQTTTEYAPIFGENPVLNISNLTPQHVRAGGLTDTVLVGFDVAPDAMGVTYSPKSVMGGFSEALKFLSNVTGLQLPNRDDKDGARPIVAISDSQGNALFYDARAGGLTVYPLKYDPNAQKYRRVVGEVTTDGRDAAVPILPGLHVLVGGMGVPGGKVRQGSMLSRGSTLFKQYDKMVDAVDRYRLGTYVRRLGGAFVPSPRRSE